MLCCMLPCSDDDDAGTHDSDVQQQGNGSTPSEPPAGMDEHPKAAVQELDSQQADMDKEVGDHCIESGLRITA